MNIGELAQKVTVLEVKMSNIEDALREGKEDRKSILARLGGVEKKIYIAIGAGFAGQFLLGILLKIFLK